MPALGSGLKPDPTPLRGRDCFQLRNSFQDLRNKRLHPENPDSDNFTPTLTLPLRGRGFWGSICGAAAAGLSGAL